eukprot:157849-Chlamydomonas_euryale.AAC.2
MRQHLEWWTWWCRYRDGGHAGVGAAPPWATCSCKDLSSRTRRREPVPPSCSNLGPILTSLGGIGRFLYSPRGFGQYRQETPKILMCGTPKLGRLKATSYQSWPVSAGTAMSSAGARAFRSAPQRRATASGRESGGIRGIRIRAGIGTGVGARAGFGTLAEHPAFSQSAEPRHQQQYQSVQQVSSGQSASG